MAGTQPHPSCQDSPKYTFPTLTQLHLRTQVYILIVVSHHCWLNSNFIHCGSEYLLMPWVWKSVNGFSLIFFFRAAFLPALFLRRISCLRRYKWGSLSLTAPVDRVLTHSPVNTGGRADCSHLLAPTFASANHTNLKFNCESASGLETGLNTSFC